MPTTITGQNGAVIKQSTPIEVQGCTLTLLSHSIRGRSLTLTVLAPSAGTLTAGGRGLSTTSKHAGRREAVTIVIHQRRSGRLTTRVKLTFAPHTGRHSSQTTQVTFSR